MSDKPLLLISGLHRKHRDRVRDFALRLGAPLYAEPLSGLREDPQLEPLRLNNERMLARGGFTRVIRVGHVPTLRFWRDLDESRGALPVVSFSRLPFPGLCRGDVWPIDALRSLRLDPRRRDQAFFDLDRANHDALERILDEEPHSELALIRKLSRELPDKSRVYLGNSLPVREWDLAATRADRGFTIEANRGANGIDGQLSTFFGGC
ncbi:MAG TPA: 2-succinyl-5-enolpyruvyl-6-hydroxy-3-cyclohexene-1-carboxylic-acid synthase, partial [Thermoanaerobaculia bacterium]|nr:2-succinyl-5-enolpyruvyl-6-hydroxy-3-cyclohexene-1-carboxylic-acid synthase [Thermoanaerobaculia bacterium]